MGAFVCMIYMGVHASVACLRNTTLVHYNMKKEGTPGHIVCALKNMIRETAWVNENEAVICHKSFISSKK